MVATETGSTGPGFGGRSVFGRMTSTQKMAGLAALVLVVAALALLAVGRFSRVNYSPLYTNLSLEDASQIIEKLKEFKVPYRISGNGQVVEVPSNQLHEVRLSLAGEGLPKGKGIGFEIFDRTSFGITDFQQKLNYQRALQGELARTISELTEVQDVRVHLVIPEEELYLDRQKPPTASVLIRLGPGKKLSGAQVRAITHLVSRAVEGLDPKGVTIIDTDGNLLSGEEEGEDVSLSKLTLNQLEAKKAFEGELEARIQTMLEGIYGPKRAIVRVSADLDFSKGETESEIFEPLQDGQGVVRSSRRVNETTAGPVTIPGGIPGTTSNIGPGEIPGISTYQATETESARQDYSEEVMNYEITRHIQRETRAPGRIQRLSVAAVVDADLTPQARDSLERAVAAAAGIDPGRGDTLFVDGMRFDTSLAEAVRAAMGEEARPAAPPSGRGKAPFPVLESVLAGLVVLLLILLLLSLRRRRAPRELAGPSMAELMPAAEAELAAAGAEVPEALEEKPISDESRRIYMELQDLLNTRPEVVAKALEAWISEGDSGVSKGEPGRNP